MSLLLGVLVTVAACDSGRGLPPIPPPSATVYRLGAGDQVRIITFGETQLTGNFRVDDKGKLAFPLIGVVNAGGLTPGDLGAEIASGLKSKEFLKSPNVSVEVTTYRPIFVLGEVSKPGEYPYQPGITFLSTVALAGGFTYRAVTNRGEVIRNETGSSVKEGTLSPASLIEPGDVVLVLERYF